MGSYGPPTRTVGQVIADVTRAFGDEAEIVLESADIVRWINDAMDTIVNRISVLKARVNIPTVAGQKEYSLIQYNINDIEAVHYNGVRLPVMPFAEVEEKLFSSDQSDDGGEPVLWYLWESTLSLWPVPQGEGELTIYYSASPSHVSLNSSQIIPMPDNLYQLIVQYVLQEAHAMNEDWSASQARQAQFDTNIAAIGESNREEQHSTYGAITIINDF